MACVPSEDSDQPGHPPCLIGVFAVHMMKAWTLSYPLSAQRRLLSDWADAQAELILRWAHMPFCWFCHDAAHLGLMTASSNFNCSLQICRIIFFCSLNNHFSRFSQTVYQQVSCTCTLIVLVKPFSAFQTLAGKVSDFSFQLKASVLLYNATFCSNISLFL